MRKLLARRPRLSARILLALGSVSLLFVLLYYAALHDIWHDYASAEILAAIGGDVAAEPWWSCPGEWTVLQVGYLPILVFNVVALVWLWRRRHEPPV